MLTHTSQKDGTAGSVAIGRFATAAAAHGAETMKDVAGYDVKRLYIGAHGAFGALVTLIFKVAVKPIST